MRTEIWRTNTKCQQVDKEGMKGKRKMKAKQVCRIWLCKCLDACARHSYVSGAAVDAEKRLAVGRIVFSAIPRSSSITTSRYHIS